MASCYILYSEKLNRFYIGSTEGEVEDRLARHNNQYYGSSKYTAKADDWQLYLKIETDEGAKARKIERKIKAMKSSVYIRNLKKYPEMQEKLKSLY